MVGGGGLRLGRESLPGGYTPLSGRAVKNVAPAFAVISQNLKTDRLLTWRSRPAHINGAPRKIRKHSRAENPRCVADRAALSVMAPAARHRGRVVRSVLCGVDHVKAPFIFDPGTRREPSVGSPAGRTRIECRGDARKPGSPLLFRFYSGRHGLVRDRTRNHQPHRAYSLRTLPLSETLNVDGGARIAGSDLHDDLNLVALS
jgi:hypothetical protein